MRICNEEEREKRRKSGEEDWRKEADEKWTRVHVHKGVMPTEAKTVSG